MYVHLLHKDFAPLVSTYPKSFDEESTWKSLTYFFLGVLKRLPRIEDFKTSPKYKSLTQFENKETNPHLYYANLHEFSLAEMTVSARTPAEAKKIAIATFVTKKLNLQLDQDSTLNIYEQGLTWSSYPKHTLFISCPRWEYNSLTLMQREYYRDRPALGLDDFLMVGLRRCVDGSICSHRVLSSDWNWKAIVATHVTVCLEKKIDENGAARRKSIEALLDAEQKYQRNSSALAWRRTGDVPNPQEKEALRLEFPRQHPYFARLNYGQMTTRIGNTDRYPLISPDGLERIPKEIKHVYDQYSSPTFLGNLGDLTEVNQWASKTIGQLYSVWKKNNYEVVPFSCFSICTLPEILKLCADPPTPRWCIPTSDRKEPFFKMAHSFCSSYIPPEVNPFNRLVANGLTSGLILLSHMKLWHIFPPPKPKTQRKKATTTMNTTSKSSTEAKFSAAEYEKSFYVLTVGFPGPLYDAWSRNSSVQKHNFSDGPPLDYQLIENKKPEDTYQRYQLYQTLCPKPVTKHLSFKTLETILSFNQSLSVSTGIPLDMLFDTALAQPAYDRNSSVFTPFV